MPEVLVPVARLARWVENFEARHGATTLSSDGEALRGDAEDGSTFTARLPFDRTYAGPADVAAFAQEAAPPGDWGVLLVRKGGFAVARVHGDAIAESKVGQRHVQGRSKAGGWSQQRFARRRDNQARAAYDAAADHARRILGSVGPVVAGGDRSAVDAVLEELEVTVVGPFLAVPEPRRSVLESAVADACSVRIDVTNA